MAIKKPKLKRGFNMTFESMQEVNKKLKDIKGIKLVHKELKFISTSFGTRHAAKSQYTSLTSNLKDLIDNAIGKSADNKQVKIYVLLFEDPLDKEFICLRIDDSAGGIEDLIVFQQYGFEDADSVKRQDGNSCPEHQIGAVTSISHLTDDGGEFCISTVTSTDPVGTFRCIDTLDDVICEKQAPLEDFDHYFKGEYGTSIIIKVRKTKLLSV
ncbi:hypothetical protein [Sutcliffiella horikoshii]|uniref:hypothetical protein n=1 Tax=Sutcliffiella horikoshii TaxID=79883 RepID=UPI00384F2A5F